MLFATIECHLTNLFGILEQPLEGAIKENGKRIFCPATVRIELVSLSNHKVQMSKYATLKKASTSSP